mgnify:CR=1 FL=1
MYLLHIEHAVPDFAMWKTAFDSDPLGRVESGVRSYRVSRPLDDANFAVIDLLFDTRAQAEGLATKLQELWEGPARRVMINPQWRISEMVEEVVL